MPVLDTDCVSLLDTGSGPEAERLTVRLAACGEIVAVTVTSFEEQMKGRLAKCAAARTAEEYSVASESLRRTLDKYRTRIVLPFTPEAALEFDRLKALRVRVGTMDLRIAAIARSLDATLVTRNLADFRKVPGLKAVDWAAA